MYHSLLHKVAHKKPYPGIASKSSKRCHAQISLSQALSVFSEANRFISHILHHFPFVPEGLRHIRRSIKATRAQQARRSPSCWFGITAADTCSCVSHGCPVVEHIERDFAFASLSSSQTADRMCPEPGPDFRRAVACHPPHLRERPARVPLLYGFSISGRKGTDSLPVSIPSYVSSQPGVALAPTGTPRL